MCDPFSIAAAALTIGGGLAQSMGAAKAQKAQAAAYQGERKRQKNFDKQQQGLFADSLRQTGDLQDPNAQQGAIDKRAAVLESGVKPTADIASYLPGSSSAPAVVATAADSASAGRRAETMQLADALARMGAPGDQLLHTNLGLQRNAGAIDQVAGFKRNSSEILPMELQAAASKGSTLRGIGSLASTIGQAYLGGGFGGGAGGLTSAPLSISNMPSGIAFRPQDLAMAF